MQTRRADLRGARPRARRRQTIFATGFLNRNRMTSRWNRCVLRYSDDFAILASTVGQA